MEFIKAQPRHLGAISRITFQAKQQLKGMGVDQWQRGYPNREVWQADIARGEAWLAVENGEVVGAFTFLTEPEPSYAVIEGQWLAERPYASIHRVCVADGHKGRGVAGQMLAHGFEMARQQGLSAVRVDTHRDNRPMQRAIAKAGFSYCGVIRLVGGVEDGNERIAFEKLL